MNNICYDAYKNLSIIDRQGKLEIAPCCMSPHSIEQTISFHNSPYLQNIRAKWTDNTFPSECNACQNLEQMGFNSRRMGSNQWYVDTQYDNTDVELIRIDYWVGDTCNLKCVTCGPENSSAWKQELDLPIEMQKSNNNQLWKTLDLARLKFVHFTGGEPLLSKEHIDFLENIPFKNQVHINYNTNGTILPSAKLLDLWSKFKLVQIDFSIDDVSRRFEYIRFPAKWDDVTSNLKWFIENCPINCMFAVNTTVGILNSASIPDLVSWLTENFYSNRLGDPIEFRQQLVLGNFSIDSDISQVATALDEMDRRRNTDWRSVFPELHQTCNK